MKTIRELADRPLRWIQADTLERGYELRAGEEVVGTLTWARTFGSLAIAETAAGTWTLKRSGFLRPHVTVRDVGSETEVAVLELTWQGEGVVRAPAGLLATGRRYQWTHVDFGGCEFAFVTDAGKACIQFRPEFVQGRRAAEVLVAPGEIANPDLALLASLGWYLMVLIREETATTAALTPIIAPSGAS